MTDREESPGTPDVSTPDLLQLAHLRTYFHTRSGVVRAVNDVSLTIRKGETLGIVGESGSGKSVVCYSLLRLIPEPPGRIEAGEALFQGVDLLHCDERTLRTIRGNHISMILQDPMTSLNPYLRIGDQVTEPLRIHRRISPNDAFELGVTALGEVGIQDAARRMRSYPHEFSGGMRQRVMIALALITKPALLLADEPTTALDVTVQAQILELIQKLQSERGTAVIFVSHDIGVISGICDRVLVMYAGQVMESAPTAALFYEPRHPYNQALQRSIPALQRRGDELRTIPGAPPDVSRPIAGCPFAPRCEYAKEKCTTSPIELLEIAPGHATACLRVQLGEIELSPASSIVAGE
ncbi:MAG: ABC transporter ATP-binding protein [Chthoniobacterales bacterium]